MSIRGAGKTGEAGVSSGPHQSIVTNGGFTAKAAIRENPISYLNLPHKGQLAVLCVARFAEPLAATSISSYMFYQLKFFDPAASDALISTHAGIIIGAKTAAQVCTGMFWGRLADSESGGRKLVLVIGLLSCCISVIGYGFSTTFASAVAWQVFGGAMSSNVAIVRCMVAELNPEKRYRTRALLLLPLCANGGILIGPLVGGFLSSHTGNGWLRSYPYAPPNLVIGLMYALTAVGVLLFLNETLESLQDREANFVHRTWSKILRRIRRDKSIEHDYVPINADEAMSPTSPVVELTPTSVVPESPKRKAKLPFWRIWTYNVICTLLAHFIVAGHLSTFGSLWAIFLSTPVGSAEASHPPLRFTGGLGMLPRDVGFAMSMLGALGVVLQAAIYPLLNDRFGTVKTWRAALFVFPLVYILAPFPSLVASTTYSGGSAAPKWLAMSFVLLLFVIGRMGVVPATTLLINDCTPHPSVRGTIHTAGTVTGNLSRSIFPFVALVIFGRGLQIGVVGLGFWCLAGLAVLACVASRWVTEGSNGKEIKLEGDEEQAESSPNGGTTVR